MSEPMSDPITSETVRKICVYTVRVDHFANGATDTELIEDRVATDADLCVAGYVPVSELDRLRAENEALKRTPSAEELARAEHEWMVRANPGHGLPWERMSNEYRRRRVQRFSDVLQTLWCDSDAASAEPQG